MPDAAVGTMGRGVLRPDLAAMHLRLDRHKPADTLAPFVDYYWIVRWDLRGRPPYEQTVLPHPNVNLVFEASGAGIFGVDRRLFTRSLSGLGLGFGIRFSAGGFRPFWQAPISQLTDRVVPAARLFGPRAEKTRQAIMGSGAFDADDGRMAGLAEALLHSVLPERDPLAEQAAALVSRITEDPGLRRVDQLSAESGMTARSLQRLFADYVGVSPKWVMRRARLHEAAERADSGEPVDWAALASDLGYADQAHLTRDFTVTIGVPPTRYAAAPLPESPTGRWRGRQPDRRPALAAGIGGRRQRPGSAVGVSGRGQRPGSAAGVSGRRQRPASAFASHASHASPESAVTTHPARHGVKGPLPPSGALARGVKGPLPPSIGGNGPFTPLPSSGGRRGG